MEVAAKFVEDRSIANPGEYKFYSHLDGDEICGLTFKCPCGCGSSGALDFRTDNPDGMPSWDWNGEIEKPTLSPSVEKTNGCKWHGYLTDGVWKSADAR